jgi:hypothetical protein
VRGHAGGRYAGAQFALRQVNDQRAHFVSIANGVVCVRRGGLVDLDAKQKSTQQRGRPMWAPERDARGCNAWLAAIATMLTAHPSAVGQHFLLRATNSSDGNPFTATAWGEGHETAGRSRVSLCALLQAGPYGVPAAIDRALTGHSMKHLLPNVGRSLQNLGDAVINEIGCWLVMLMAWHENLCVWPSPLSTSFSFLLTSTMPNGNVQRGPDIYIPRPCKEYNASRCVFLTYFVFFNVYSGRRPGIRKVLCVMISA